MSFPIYVVDAFTGKPFAGNPAAVCLLDRAVDDRWMQRVAAEMKHAETAFVTSNEGSLGLRWFTPTLEVDLCGHATLAAAHVLWESKILAFDQAANFQTRSGLLTATNGERIRLDFPNEEPVATPLPHQVEGLVPIWTGKNRMDWVVEVASEAEVKDFVPDFDNILSLGMRGLQVTARGSAEFDFVSRFFAPQSGVPEDPVTGSAHCSLGPYWARRLDKTSLLAYQASERGGVVGVDVSPSRVALFGEAVTVLAGELRC